MPIFRDWYRRMKAAKVHYSSGRRIREIRSPDVVESILGPTGWECQDPEFPKSFELTTCDGQGQAEPLNLSRTGR